MCGKKTKSVSFTRRKLKGICQILFRKLLRAVSPDGRNDFPPHLNSFSAKCGGMVFRLKIMKKQLQLLEKITFYLFNRFMLKIRYP